MSATPATVENYDRLRAEGFLGLTVGKEWGRPNRQ
jgi:hypothetical protein